MDGIYVAGNHCDDRSIGPALAIPLRTCCGHQKQLSSAWLVYVYLIVNLWCCGHSFGYEEREYNSHTHVHIIHDAVIFIGSELQNTRCLWYCPKDSVVTPYLPIKSSVSHHLSSPIPYSLQNSWHRDPHGDNFDFMYRNGHSDFQCSPDLIKASSQDHFGIDPDISHSLNLSVI